MARIAYILLCHKDPEGVIEQATQLTAAGDFVVIHHDGRAPAADHARLRAGLASNSAVTFAPRRHRCGWGEWSLVAATLEAARAALAQFPRATHFYLLSGDCMPIKTAEHAHAMLDRIEADHIESVDFLTSGWIKTGIREERLIYRHWFNERSQKGLFYGAMAIQQRLGLSRRIPPGLKMRIGSQWWCLRRRTLEAVLEFCAARPSVPRFFRTTWIPDETFFQTLVWHLVPESEIRSRPPTFLMFTDYGMPVTFYDDHHDLLLAQDYLFARKISPDAQELKARLGALYARTGVAFALADEGRALFRFLTGRGREGRRFAPRFWETAAALPGDLRLMVIVCRKWHVGKRLAARLQGHGGALAVDYLFDEAETRLPDLGGVETTLEKRRCHARAVISLLSEVAGGQPLVICLDPASLPMMAEIGETRLGLRVLEVECNFSEADLLGHARRIGLACEQTPRSVAESLLSTLGFELVHEAAAWEKAGFPNFHRLRQSASLPENAAALAAFLGMDAAEAAEILGDASLFKD